MAMGAGLTWDGDDCECMIISGERAPIGWAGSVMSAGVRRQALRVGAPDPTLPAVSGMAAVTEPVDRLGLIEYLDGAVGPI
jgi:hypothetical protein